jgi:hypothetical protein
VSISFDAAVEFHRNGHVARGVNEMKELVKQAHEAMEAYHRRLEGEVMKHLATRNMLAFTFEKLEDLGRRFPDVGHDPAAWKSSYEALQGEIRGAQELLEELAAGRRR